MSRSVTLVSQGPVRRPIDSDLQPSWPSWPGVSLSLGQTTSKTGRKESLSGNRAKAFIHPSVDRLTTRSVTEQLCRGKLVKERREHGSFGVTLFEGVN